MTDLWYAAYGSNLSRERFTTYLSGGRPVGAAREYPGARDRRPPSDDRALLLPGRIFFAGLSLTWGGGMAFYDPDAAGTVYARAYRITAAQFSDVAAQEMRRPPGADLDLEPVLLRHRHTYGPGRYETLHLVGELEERPVLTFTAPTDHGLVPNPPAAGYLATIARGLREGHGLDDGAVADYLAAASATAGRQLSRPSTVHAPSAAPWSGLAPSAAST